MQITSKNTASLLYVMAYVEEYFKKPKTSTLS